jgi:pyruvate ferredoxin oxidoreductase delta subunit
MKDNRMKSIHPENKWQDLTIAGYIYASGNSEEFNTGDWRTATPKWNQEKCKQCLLCFPVCPDCSIVLKDGKMSGIDYEHCKGCGICAKTCPFNAIDFEKDGE